MSVRLTIFASGSKGNCALLETDGTRLLVDAGLSATRIQEHLAAVDRAPSDLHGILLTHEHDDHTSALRVFAARHELPVFTNQETRCATLEASRRGARDALDLDWRIFRTGEPFAVGDFDVDPFSIPHDACDPVGFLFRAASRSVAFVTDLGQVTALVADKARQAEALVLEANHEHRLLMEDPNRSWAVKQRISGSHGHLSNEKAARALERIVSDRLSHVFLAHLSEDCNRPDLAEETMRRGLEELGASRVKVTVAHQREPCATLELASCRAVAAETLPLFGLTRAAA
ncbi:MAG: MBL fold metallo-hydrolase [Verrucomicrobiae bacterium]|nr:MBL fold metallo-hydrolase [Verrucomicrobiae bacterium]